MPIKIVAFGLRIIVLNAVFELLLGDRLRNLNPSQMELIQRSMETRKLLPTHLQLIAKAFFDGLAGLKVFRKGHEDGCVLDGVFGTRYNAVAIVAGELRVRLSNFLFNQQKGKIDIDDEFQTNRLVSSAQDHILSQCCPTCSHTGTANCQHRVFCVHV
jgi:hypothetical protein